MPNIKLFEQKKIRYVWNEADQKRYFSVADVIQILTDTVNPKDYIKKMRKRDQELNFNWGTICPPVEIIAADGKMRKIQCANSEGLLRIIQSVPSPKAVPFKWWLAKVGYECLEEIENPELAQKRMRETYKAKSYIDGRVDWNTGIGIKWWKLNVALPTLSGRVDWNGKLWQENFFIHLSSSRLSFSRKLNRATRNFIKCPPPNASP